MTTVTAPPVAPPSLPALNLSDRRPHGLRMNLTVLGIELRRVLRNRRTLIFTLIFPVAMFFFISSTLSAGDEKIPGVTANVSAIVMVSMALYGAVMAATSAGASVSIERASGWSRQLRLTPLQPLAYITTKMLAALVLGVLATAVTFTAGLLGNADAGTGSLLLSAAVIIGGALAFAAFGLFMGYLLPAENAMQFLGPILAILSMLGGIFFPIKDGTTFDQVASFTPIYGLGKLAQWPLTETTSGGHAPFSWWWVVNLGVWALVFVVGAAWRFRRDTKRV